MRMRVLGCCDVTRLRFRSAPARGASVASMRGSGLKHVVHSRALAWQHCGSGCTEFFLQPSTSVDTPDVFRNGLFWYWRGGGWNGSGRLHGQAAGADRSTRVAASECGGHLVLCIPGEGPTLFCVYTCALLLRPAAHSKAQRGRHTIWPTAGRQQGLLGLGSGGRGTLQRGVRRTGKSDPPLPILSRRHTHVIGMPSRPCRVGLGQPPCARRPPPNQSPCSSIIGG